MKLSELLKRLEAIKSQYGDLPEIDVMIGEDFASLDHLEVEERTTLILVAENDDIDNPPPDHPYEPDYFGPVWEGSR